MHGQAYHRRAFAWTAEKTAIESVSQVDTDTLIPMTVDRQLSNDNLPHRSD